MMSSALSRPLCLPETVMATLPLDKRTEKLPLVAGTQPLLSIKRPASINCTAFSENSSSSVMLIVYGSESEPILPIIESGCSNDYI